MTLVAIPARLRRLLSMPSSIVWVCLSVAWLVVTAYVVVSLVGSSDELLNEPLLAAEVESRLDLLSPDRLADATVSARRFLLPALALGLTATLVGGDHVSGLMALLAARGRRRTTLIVERAVTLVLAGTVVVGLLGVAAWVSAVVVSGALGVDLGDLLDFMLPSVLAWASVVGVGTLLCVATQSRGAALVAMAVTVAFGSIAFDALGNSGTGWLRSVGPALPLMAPQWALTSPQSWAAAVVCLVQFAGFVALAAVLSERQNLRTRTSAA